MVRLFLDSWWAELAGRPPSPRACASFAPRCPPPFAACPGPRTDRLPVSFPSSSRAASSSMSSTPNRLASLVRALPRTRSSPSASHRPRRSTCARAAALTIGTLFAAPAHRGGRRMRRHGSRARPGRHPARGRCRAHGSSSLPVSLGRPRYRPRSEEDADLLLPARPQSDPKMIKEIIEAVTIPVMAKVRRRRFDPPLPIAAR